MSNVKAEHWQQVKEIFERALDLSGDARSAYLDEACASNPGLRHELDSLLRSFESAGSFMETPAIQAGAKSFLGASRTLSAGEILGHYEIIAPLGEGGMGEVYLAKDTRLGRRVALKLLPDYFTNDADRLRRFKQEARAASNLNHPNVCVIHEVNETDDGRPFLTMEYVEGVTLRERLRDEPGRLSDVLEIASQIADALAAAHAAGVVHRDIKPENIMLRPDGYVKVLDFGLAKLTDIERAEGADALNATTLMQVSTPGLVMGTVAYMSPEQARGLPVDFRTDVWSLGVVLYEMISGRTPFVGDTPTDVVVGIIEHDQPALIEFVAGVPAEIERIVRKALMKDREERYQLAKEMANDLRSLRRTLEVERELDRSLAPHASSGHVARRRTTNDDVNRLTVALKQKQQGSRWLVASLIVAVLAALVAGLYFAYPYFQPRVGTFLDERFRKTNVSKLTTNGRATFAAISNDGKYVTYIINDGGQESLWLRQVQVNSSVQLLGPRGGRYLGIAFSPDGNFIYFGYVESEPHARALLYRVPVLGVGASPTKIETFRGPQVPSHDGTKLAFYAYDEMKKEDRLMVTNADGSNERVVASLQWPVRFGWSWDAAPAWSKDDQKLTGATIDGSANSFFVKLHEVRLADVSTNTIELTGQRFELFNGMSMLRDASGVLIAGKAAGASFSQLWQLNRDGSARQITNDLTDYMGVSATADGSALVTVQRQLVSNVFAASSSRSADVAPVTLGFGRYFDMVWTPDGKIVYASDASGNAQIYEVTTDGANTKILADESRNYGPSVSPDNRYLAFHSNRSGLFQIWLADRDGRNAKQLTHDEPEANWPQFSPDGKWIIYQHFGHDDNGTVWRVPVMGGRPTRVVEGLMLRPAISPDGKWIAGWYRDESRPSSPWRLAVVPFEGGPPVKQFDLPSIFTASWDSPVRWSQDGRSITYIDRPNYAENLWNQPIDGSRPKQITNFKDSRIFSFDWSRDGRLLVSRGITTDDVVMISEAK